MSNEIVGSAEQNALLASVGVGLWNWDGRHKRLALDATCRQFFDMDWDEDISMQILNYHESKRFEEFWLRLLLLAGYYMYCGICQQGSTVRALWAAPA